MSVGLSWSWSLGSQSAGECSHKPGSRQPLLSAKVCSYLLTQRASLLFGQYQIMLLDDGDAHMCTCVQCALCSHQRLEPVICESQVRCHTNNAGMLLQLVHLCVCTALAAAITDRHWGGFIISLTATKWLLSISKFISQQCNQYTEMILQDKRLLQLWQPRSWIGKIDGNIKWAVGLWYNTKYTIKYTVHNTKYIIKHANHILFWKWVGT